MPAGPGMEYSSDKGSLTRAALGYWLPLGVVAEKPKVTVPFSGIDKFDPLSVEPDTLTDPDDPLRLLRWVVTFMTPEIVPRLVIGPELPDPEPFTVASTFMSTPPVLGSVALHAIFQFPIVMESSLEGFVTPRPSGCGSSMIFGFVPESRGP